MRKVRVLFVAAAVVLGAVTATALPARAVQSKKGVPAGTAGQSVGDGWVALLRPLPPGTHHITIDNDVFTDHPTIIVEA